ncbi:hypothetical protein SUGI_0217970 [Cryptomeria japonica]|nr:hypothetical protein SUGI_0217970 [Cryptomeria japonica]
MKSNGDRDRRSSRLEALQELERLRTGAPVDYLRAYIADLGDHRALEQLRRVLLLLTSLKVVSVLPHPCRDPTPLPLLLFARLRFLELRGCDLSTSAARGLLDLRHTLEKLICHNSTDALRHIFAGRIVDIQDCPVWTRLSFVSCAGNTMVLMDESLQLLPVVETLDLSRNRFAKIANLRKCTKLKHLDLGFNHIRTISSLNEVTFGISKLILRNNALTTLRGIENLITLEGLDLSFNMISNFAEIELLASLPSLESLWLEGNPISFVRLYRQQVFSFFPNPRKLILDEKAISGREAWTAKIIVARRQKQRTGHGFYAPAKCEIQSDDSSKLRNSFKSCETSRSASLQHKAKTKLSRLAWIEDSENKSYMLSEGVEQDESCPSTCDSESQRWDRIDIGENIRTSALELMSRIEFLKREKSTTCFQEMTNLLDQTNDDMEDHLWGVNYNSRNEEACMESRNLSNREDDCFKENSVGIKEPTDHGERDFHDAKSLEMLDETNNGDKMVNKVEANSIVENYSPKGKTLLESLSNNGTLLPACPQSEIRESKVSQEVLNGLAYDSVGKLTRGNLISSLHGNITDEEISLDKSLDSLKAIDEIMESRSSSYCHSSPPHYKKDILHRRQNLEEEFMQLSLESYSLASSSDSETSQDELYLSDSSCSIDCQPTSPLNIERDITDIEFDTVCDDIKEESDRSHQSTLVKDQAFLANGHPQSNAVENSKMYHAIPSHTDDILVDAGVGGLPQSSAEVMSQMMEKKNIRKKKRRVVLLHAGMALDGKCEQTGNSSSFSSGSIRNGMRLSVSKEDGIVNSEGNKLHVANSSYKVKDLCTNCAETSDCNSNTVDVMSYDSLELYFHHKVADSRVSERCIYYVSCNCVRLWEDDPSERQVAVLLSSESKLYIVLTSSSLSQPGLQVLGSHGLHDISNILVGVGLQALRVNVGCAASYLFLTRNIVKSRELLDMLGNCHLSTSVEISKFPLQSWEHMQIELFEKFALGGVRLNIILYTMLLFEKGTAWFARSLILTADYIFLCVEDLVQFGSISEEAVISEPYFVLEAWSSVCNIVELVIESKQCQSVTLVFSNIICGKFQLVTENRVFLSNDSTEAYKDELGCIVWKLKGFTEDTLLKFITLLRAVYMEATMHPLTVKSIV